MYWGQDENTWSHTNNLDRLAEGPFKIAVSDLSPGTTYGYQVFAENEFGDDISEVAWFTTQSTTAWFEGGGYDGYDWYTGTYDFPATGSTIDTVSDGAGVFIYSDAPYTGAVDYANTRLRWHHGTQRQRV